MMSRTSVAREAYDAPVGVVLGWPDRVIGW